MEDTVGESRDCQLLYSTNVEFAGIIAAACTLTAAAHCLLRLLVCLIAYTPRMPSTLATVQKVGVNSVLPKGKKQALEQALMPLLRKEAHNLASF